MRDEMWKRHANPWSVWTRFAAIPAFMLAIWSRVWLGWWSLIPISLVVIWLCLNVFVFSPLTTPRSWASKGIYGEKLWLSKRSEIPEHYAAIQRWLIILIHTSVNFASFFFRGLWIKDNILCRIVWK
jgi:hypothetical protein